MKRWNWRAVLVVGLSVHTMGVYAQQGNQDPVDSAIDNLRERQPSDLDNQIIDDWVTAAIDTLDTDMEAAPPAEAADRFVKRFADQYRNARNSVEFNRRFAERTGSVFLRAYQAEGVDPNKARALARVLSDMAAEPTREALVAGLSFSDQAVRYLSAKALVGIKADIAADARLTSVILTAIGKAGAAELNEVAAEMMYQACAYPNHSDESAASMLTIMDGRLERMRNSARGLGRADLTAIRFLDSVTLGNDQKAEVVRRLAPLLRIYVTRLTEPDVSAEERAAIEETIDESEALIRKLVNPSNAPSVSEKMQKGGDAVATEMMLDLNQWIGTEQDEGILNRSPWDVPRAAP